MKSRPGWALGWALGLTVALILATKAWAWFNVEVASKITIEGVVIIEDRDGESIFEDLHIIVLTNNTFCLVDEGDFNRYDIGDDYVADIQ